LREHRRARSKKTNKDQHSGRPAQTQAQEHRSLYGIPAEEASKLL
jgi:hypothetical protein